MEKRSSPVERDLYIGNLQTVTGVSVEAINQQFLKMAGHRAKRAKVEPKHGETILPKNAVPIRKKTGTERAKRLVALSFVK